MTTRVIDFIRSNAMLCAGDKVLCAVSGGADSMALLHILKELGTDVCCAHYNHGIRGEESDRDEEFVKNACAELNVTFVSRRGDVPAYAREHGIGTEEAARILRYEFLADCAHEMGCTKIATAHNAMDNAETMLMNLLRGTGLRGMGGIAPVRGNIIRPILCLDRPEIEAYLRDKGIAWVTDSTNLSDDYTRNRLRHRIMEPLREQNPDFGEKFLAAALSMRADEEYLLSQAEKFLAEQGECLSASALAALPDALAARAVMLKCPNAGRNHVAAVLELARGEKPHGELSLPGMKISRQYDSLVFGACEKEVPGELLLTPGSTVCWGEYSISCRWGEGKNNKRSFCFKTGEICGKISVSPRKEGDSIRLASRGVTKSLKKLFSEAKIPPDERDLVPIIRDDRGVLAVYGFGRREQDDSISEKNTLQIEIKKCEE